MNPDDEKIAKEILDMLHVPVYTTDGTAKPYPWEHSPLDGPFFDTEPPPRTPVPKGGIYHLTDSDLNDIRLIVREELQRALGIIVKENT